MPALGIGAGLDLLRSNWKLVLGGLAVLGLLIAWQLARADARHYRKLAESRLTAFQLESAKHSVTRASLDKAMAAIDDQNAAVQRLRVDGDKRASDARAALEASRRAAERSNGLVRQLEASAVAERAGEPCKPSEAFWNARTEL